jgi:hypothetical protein
MIVERNSIFVLEIGEMGVWNPPHRKLHNFCKRLQHSNNQLMVESWEDFKGIPTLVRKSIMNRLWEYLGVP